jgi:DNA (cytosine-5)-methyltransferase 1
MSTKLKFIDLFCGIGGFHQVLNDLGHQCVLACDIDKACREVYYNNYKIEPVNNVKEIDPKKLEDFDILCAGFPCQAFSNGGKKLCFEDSRGLLFDEIIRIAKVKKPMFMFLENVKHILKVSNGEVIEYIKQKIDKIGYNLQLFKMSPHEYGIPQQRERIYFVCVRKDIYKKDFELLHKKSKPEFLKFLETRDKVDKKYYISGDILNCLDAWDKMVKKFKKDEKISPTIMINDYYKFYTNEEFNNLSKWKRDYITKNLQLINKYQKEFDKFYNEHNEILNKRSIYGQLDWQCGKIKENDSIFNHFIQIRQSGIRVKKAEYFPTLVAISQIPIYGKEKRYITPRECARLQGFPESFIIDPSDKNAYKQFGNSVCVKNVRNVIESCLKFYEY